MKIKESYRKYILLGVIGLIIIGLIVAKMMAKYQDEQFLRDDLIYEQVQKLYNEEKYEEAAIYIQELLKTQPNSEVVNYMGGLISAINQDYNKAAILMQKTLNINPHRVEDAIFMLQLGEIFYQAKRYDDARIVLTHCQEKGWAPEEYPNYQDKVLELLNSIENQE